MCDCYKATVLDTKCSSPMKSTVGVPQAWIIGSLIFSIFISDVNKVCSTANRIREYSDDTNFILSQHEFEQLIENFNNASSEFSEYGQQNGVTWNATKTYFIHFLPKNISSYYDPWYSYADKVCANISSLCYVSRNLKVTVLYNVI